MRAHCGLSALLFLLSPGLVMAQVERHAHGAHDSAGLGVVEFVNTGAPAAQEPFRRGLALLHSFEYEEAAEAFRAAQQADADFAMAYWGEALTHAHLLWGEDDPGAARRALSRLAATPSARLTQAGSARERAYGQAVEALFADADLAARVRAFSDAMGQVVANYPDDVDAGAFYALALMFKEYVGNLSAQERRAARSAAISQAERIYRAQPRHPGSTHYLIHATDDPAFAARGLQAARSYAELAPAAEHALHMPSHIFLQLGLWDDVVASNERSWAASRAEVVARNLSTADLSFHALQWLQYGYLQQGRFQRGQALIDTARAVLATADLQNPLHVDARYTVAWLEFVQAAHTGQWTDALCRRTREPVSAITGTSDRERQFQALAVYHTTVTAAQCGLADAPTLESVRALAEQMHASDPNLAVVRSAWLHATAISAQRRGEHARVIELLQAEAAAPARPPVGPASTVRVHELLGTSLLEAGRAPEAVAMFERALELTPNRSSALLGLARARRATGDARGAGEVYRRLLQNWERADASLSLLNEVRTGAR